ncbi:hypothetical protein IJS77_00935 [bacterium]|nr:hypothetical protein [bacterium]
MEFLDGVFTHLAIVNNPRYERANIVFNSKTVIAPIEVDITKEIHNNKEIQFLYGLKEILSNYKNPTQEDLKVLNGLCEIFNSEGENSLGEFNTVNNGGDLVYFEGKLGFWRRTADNRPFFCEVEIRNGLYYIRDNL